MVKNKIKCGSFRRQVKRKRDSLRKEIDATINAKISCLEPINETEPSSSTTESNPSVSSPPLSAQPNTAIYEEDAHYSGEDMYFSPSEGEDDISDRIEHLSV